jgi:hypothetical protein
MIDYQVRPVSLSYKDIIGIIALPSSTKSGKKTEIPVQTVPYKRSKVMNYRSNYLTKGQFELPEYNLSEVSAAEDGDGIIRQAIKKKGSLGFKEGWSLNGLNTDTMEYIEERFLQIALSSGKPIDQIFDETFMDLVRFNNAFWIMVRDTKNTSGITRTVKTRSGEKEIDPIIAVFRAAPETMRIKTDKYGNPTSYMQIMPDGRYNTFSADNVLHFYVNRRAGFNLAAPALLPAIDEVRSLRQMEEFVEMLVEQYLFPLFTLTVGTEQWPVMENPDGSTEVDTWSTKINSLEVNGGLVLSHRVKMDIHRLDKTLPVEEYLKHFKQRVFTACGVSPIDMGETDTSNRSTADSATKQLIDDVKFYQRGFKQHIEFKFINQLLLERYSASVLRKQHVVGFDFNEIDIESMIKMQNHYAMMYSMNYMTEDEARIKGNMPVISSENQRSKMFLTVYETPKLEAEAKNTTQAGQTKPTSGASSQVKSQQQPSNQHGTKSGPSKRTSSLRSEDIVRLSVVLGDFATSDSDLTKLKLSNWILSIDKTIHDAHFCYTIKNTLDNLVEETYKALDLNTSDPIDLKNTLYNQTLDLFTEK